MPGICRVGPLIFVKSWGEEVAADDRAWEVADRRDAARVEEPARPVTYVGVQSLVLDRTGQAEIARSPSQVIVGGAEDRREDGRERRQVHQHDPLLAMQDGVRQARAAPGVAVSAAGALAVRMRGNDFLGLALATLPQELDLVRIQDVPDHDEAVAVEDPDRVVDLLRSQDLEARHAIVGFQVASQLLDIHV